MGFISDIALGSGEELAPKKKRGFIADIALGAADAPVAPSIDESMYPPDSQYAKTNRQRKAMQDAYNQGLGIEGIRAAHAKAMSDGGGDVFTGEELAKKNLLPDTDTNPTVDAFKGAALGAARGLPLINTFVPPTPLETASAPTYGIAGLKGDVAVGAAQLAGPLAAEASELMTGTKLIGGAVKGAKGMSLAIGGLNAAQSLRQNARDKRIAELQQTGEDPGLIGGLKQLDAPALGAASVAGVAGGAMAGYGIKMANNLGGAVSNQIMNSAPARKAVEAVTKEGIGEIAKRKAIEAVNSNVSGPVIRNIAKSLGADVVGGTVTQSAEMLARGQNPIDNPGQLAAGALIQGAASGAGQIASARGIIGAGRTHAANQLRSNMGAQQNALASAHDMNTLPTLRDMDGNPVPPIYVAPHGEPVAGAEPIRTVEVPRGPTPFRDMDGNPVPLREDIPRNPPPINRLMLPAPENPSAPPRFPRYVSPTGEVGDVGISPSGVMRKIDDKQFIPMRKDFAPPTEAQSPEGKVIPSTEAGAGGHPPSVPNPRVANAQAELNALLQRPYLNAKMQNRAEVLRSIVNGGNPKVVAARQAAAQADAAAVIARQAAIGEDIDPEIAQMVNGMEDASAQRPLTDPTKAPIMADKEEHTPRFVQPDGNEPVRDWTEKEIDAALDSLPKTDATAPKPTKKGRGIKMRNDRGFALNPFAPNPKRPMNAAQVDAEFDRLFSPKKPTESAIPMREPVTQAPELDATTNPTKVDMNTRVRADQFTFPERSTAQAYDSTERIESMNPKRMAMTPEELGVFKKFADDNKELIAAKIKRTTHEKVTIGAESVEINDRFINDAFSGKKILTKEEDMALGSHLSAYEEASALTSAQYKVALEAGTGVDEALKAMKTQNVRSIKATMAYFMSGTNFGQSLEARKIMRKRWTLDEKSGLSIPDNYVNEATKKLYNMVKGKAQADIELAIERMAAFDPDDAKGMFKFLNDLQQNGKWNAGKINLYFMSNLLSGVKTHLVNISSNLNNLVLGNTATIIDSAQMRMAGDKSRSPLGEMGAIAKGQGAGFVIGMDKAFQIIKRGYTDDAISALELPSIEFNVPFTKGMKNQEVIRGFNPWNTTLRALRAADVMFATMGFEGDLVRQALVKSRGSAEWKTATKAQRSKMIEGWREKPTMKMLEDARKAALGATFQTGYDESTGGEFMKAFSRMVNTPVGRGPAKGLRPGAFVVPFIKTLYNIMRKNVHYSPAGLLRLMGAEDSVARAGGKSKIIAESVVLGSALVAVGKYARDNGMLEFSTPRDAGEREDFYGAKRRPNSIFGVPMKYLGPIIFPIVAGGLISDAIRKNGTPKSEKEFQKSVAQASSTMFDQSFMTQANQVMKAMSEGDWSQFGSNFASGFVPLVSFQRQTSQLADDRVREAETFGEKVVRGTYAQGNLPMRLDRFGGEIHRGGEPDPVDVEIDRLDMRLASPNQGFSREGFQPEDMPMTLLRDRLRTMQPAKEAIRNVMKGKGWESMPDYAKAKVIREIYDNFRSQGAKRAGAAFQSGRPMSKDAEYQGEKKYQRIPLR